MPTNPHIHLRALISAHPSRLASHTSSSRVLCGVTSPLDMDAFTAHVLTDHLPHAIIIDCSDSEEVAERHAQWLEKARQIYVSTHPPALS